MLFVHFSTNLKGLKAKSFVVKQFIFRFRANFFFFFCAFFHFEAICFYQSLFSFFRTFIFVRLPVPEYCSFVTKHGQFHFLNSKSSTDFGYLVLGLIDPNALITEIRSRVDQSQSRFNFYFFTLILFLDWSQ